jgi:DNA-binding MarR family transcriptional regulator
MNQIKERNLIGAIAVALADEINRVASSTAPEEGPAASALALINHAPGISIRSLARGVGLTHAGTVRLVDRLESLGLIERRLHATDGRTRSLHLTSEGELSCDSILRARDQVITRGLSALTREEQRTLGELAERMLRAIVEDEDHAYRICRLCDFERCKNCPVGEELVSRDGQQV